MRLLTAVSQVQVLFGAPSRVVKKDALRESPVAITVSGLFSYLNFIENKKMHFLNQWKVIRLELVSEKISYIK